MKNENQMEMQIHTTQTNSHMHAMGGKLHIPHILNHISTHTHHPHPPSLSSCSHCSSCETGPLEFCICICISPATCQIRLKAEGLASACKWMCSIFQQIRTTFELFGHCVNIPDPINPKQPMHRWSSAGRHQPFIFLSKPRFLYLLASHLFDQLVNMRIQKWNIQNASTNETPSTTHLKYKTQTHQSIGRPATPFDRVCLLNTGGIPDRKLFHKRWPINFKK